MADRTGTFYAVADDSVHGYGAEFLIGDDGSPETFQAVAGLRRITPGDATTADIDVTHLRSPAAHREHRPGIRDNGPFSIEGIFLPGDESQALAGGGSGSFASGGIYAFWKDRSIHNFQIQFTEGSPNHDFSFRGYISQFQMGEIGIDDVVSFTASVMPTESYDVP